MKPKRLTDRTMRMIARRERDGQWEFMERVAREGIVWMCPWDKYGRHKNGDGVYVFGLLGRGRWSEKRCARSIRITTAGRKALKNRAQYDMEPIFGGMVEPGYVVTPWPQKRTVSDVRDIRGLFNRIRAEIEA